MPARATGRAFVTCGINDRGPCTPRVYPDVRGSAAAMMMMRKHVYPATAIVVAVGQVLQQTIPTAELC